MNQYTIKRIKNDEIQYVATISAKNHDEAMNRYMQHNWEAAASGTYLVSYDKASWYRLYEVTVSAPRPSYAIEPLK